MGFFDWLKSLGKKESQTRLIGTNWYPPIYTTFGNDIYASDVVQQAISCIVREMKKSNLKHIVAKGSLDEDKRDEVQYVLDSPNPLMTQSEFIEKIIWHLYLNYNSFVFPIWTKDGALEALYPLKPNTVDFLQDASGQIFVQFIFANGYECTLRYEDVIHIRYNYSVSEFMGGNIRGQPDNEALLKSLELNKSLLDGVAKALNSSFAVNGVVKYNTLLDNGKTEKAIADLTERLKKNESGFLAMDLKGEFVPFNRSVQLVDEGTLKFIDEKILRHFGVPLCILTGDYTKTQYEAFYQKTLEPLIVSISQSFTKCIFSKRERNGYGHKIVMTHDRMDFMTMDEKIKFATIASNVGGITVDEFRAMFGFTPYGNDLGDTPLMSKNYGDANAVKEQVLVENKLDNQTQTE